MEWIEFGNFAIIRFKPAVFRGSFFRIFLLGGPYTFLNSGTTPYFDFSPLLLQLGAVVRRGPSMSVLSQYV